MDGLVMADIKMGENAKLELRDQGDDVWQLWLNPDIDHPQMPTESIVCLGAKESLNWVASSLAAYHHIRFAPVE